MQSAIERRQQVLEAISDRRTERIENLASEFGVSRRTIERDIQTSLVSMQTRASADTVYKSVQNSL